MWTEMSYLKFTEDFCVEYNEKAGYQLDLNDIGNINVEHEGNEEN